MTDIVEKKTKTKRPAKPAKRIKRKYTRRAKPSIKSLLRLHIKVSKVRARLAKMEKLLKKAAKAL